MVMIPRIPGAFWQAEGNLPGRKGGSSVPWNKMSPEKKARVLAAARALPLRKNQEGKS